MDSLKETLLAIDTMIPIALFFGGFIAYEVYSGKIPLRWFGNIDRDHSPIIYWLGILFHMSIFGVLVYAWMQGVKMPVSIFFD